MMIANVDNDIGESWQWSASGFVPIAAANETYKLGINYVIYALTTLKRQSALFGYAAYDAQSPSAAPLPELSWPRRSPLPHSNRPTTSRSPTGSRPVATRSSPSCTS